jgi:hypothetical protein
MILTIALILGLVTKKVRARSRPSATARRTPTGLRNMNKIAAAITAGAVALAASGCYYTTSGRPVPNSTSATTVVAAPSSSAPPTKPALQPGPHSWVADIDLPEGTAPCATFMCSDSPYEEHDPHRENWRYSAPYDDTVAWLRDRFATGRRYDTHGATWWKGLPPCYDTVHQSPPSGWAGDGFIRWVWADGARWLQIDVLQPGRSMPFGVVSIGEGFDPEIVRKSMCYRA